jgi:hypothetical protein
MEARISRRTAHGVTGRFMVVIRILAFPAIIVRRRQGHNVQVHSVINHEFLQLNITGRLHAGQCRKILEGQKIHASAIFRPDYRPKAAYPGYPFADWPQQLNLREPASHYRLKALEESESHWEADLFNLGLVDLLFCGFDPPQEEIEDLMNHDAFLSSFGSSVIFLS